MSDRASKCAIVRGVEPPSLQFGEASDSRVRIALEQRATDEQAQRYLAIGRSL